MHMMKISKRRLKITIIVLAFAWVVLAGLGVFPCWIVFGRVVDELGNPVERANVTAAIVFEVDRSVRTGADGNFLLTVALTSWSDSKGGSTGIRVDKRGFRRYESGTNAGHGARSSRE